MVRSPPTIGAISRPRRRALDINSIMYSASLAGFRAILDIAGEGSSISGAAERRHFGAVAAGAHVAPASSHPTAAVDEEPGASGALTHTCKVITAQEILVGECYGIRPTPARVGARSPFEMETVAFEPAAAQCCADPIMQPSQCDGPGRLVTNDAEHRHVGVLAKTVQLRKLAVTVKGSIGEEASALRVGKEPRKRGPGTNARPVGNFVVVPGLTGVGDRVEEIEHRMTADEISFAPRASNRLSTGYNH